MSASTAERLTLDPTLDPEFLAREAAADAQHRRDSLRRLLDMGMEFAAAVHKRAMAHLAEPDGGAPGGGKPAPSTVPALALAFDRLARAVRGTAALAAKLAQPPRAATQRSAAPKPARAAAKPAPRLAKPLLLALERFFLGGDPDAYARLSDAKLAELRAYLDGFNPAGSADDMPLDQLVAALCVDLGWHDADQPAMVTRVSTMRHPRLELMLQAVADQDAWRAEYRAIQERLAREGYPVLGDPMEHGKKAAAAAFTAPHPNGCAGPPVF
jgi:hypothetical protein